MPHQCNRVYLDQGCNSRFLDSLETLCLQTSGLLRVDMEEQDSLSTGNTIQRIFLRERTLFEAICEEFVEFFGGDVKAERIEHSLLLLEQYLPRAVVNVRSDAKKLCAMRSEDGTPSLLLEPDDSHPTTMSAALRHEVFARVAGCADGEVAEPVLMHRLSDAVLTSQYCPRRGVDVPDGLSLSQRDFSQVNADEYLIAREPRQSANENTNPWGDESKTLEEATVQSGQLDTAATWKMAFEKQLREVPEIARTIAIGLPSNASDEQIEGLLMAVKEKVSTPAAVKKRVSIMLAVKDGRLYDRVAERMYAAQGRTYTKMGMRALATRKGIAMSSASPEDYDYLLKITQKFVQNAKRAVRAKIAHCGVRRKTMLYERERFSEFFEPAERTVKRERDTFHALVHAFEPVLHDAEARGLNKDVIETHRSFLDALLSKITEKGKTMASDAGASESAVATPFDRVPHGFSIAPPGNSPLGYIANTVILGSGVMPESGETAPQELKDAVDTFNAAWEDPQKTVESDLFAIKSDRATDPSATTATWWAVACEDGLHHIERLHVVPHEAPQSHAVPKTRQDFKAIYLAMFAQLSGSVVLEPIADLEVRDGRKDGSLLELKWSPQNLEGMLDAIAERVTAGQGKRMLSILVTIPEGNERKRLFEAAKRRGMLKETGGTMSPNLSTAPMSTGVSSSVQPILEHAVDEDE